MIYVISAQFLSHLAKYLWPYESGSQPLYLGVTSYFSLKISSSTSPVLPSSPLKFCPPGCHGSQGLAQTHITFIHFRTLACYLHLVTVDAVTESLACPRALSQLLCGLFSQISIAWLLGVTAYTQRLRYFSRLKTGRILALRLTLASVSFFSLTLWQKSQRLSFYHFWCLSSWSPILCSWPLVASILLHSGSVLSFILLACQYHWSGGHMPLP